MVLRLDSPLRTPGLVIPDDSTWTLAGLDPAELGIEPSGDGSRLRRVLAPMELPEALLAGMSSLAGGIAVERRELPLPAARPDPPPAADESDSTEGEDDEDADPMEITGTPSADGLVMESMELLHGPLAGGLPGGLTISATLDGEIVTAAQVRGMTVGRQDAWSLEAPPDPLAPRTWRAALIEYQGATSAQPPVAVDRRSILALLELERATSHLAWFRSFLRLIGLRAPIESLTAVIRLLLAVSARLSEEPTAEVSLISAGEATQRVAEAARKNRSMGRLTAGLGSVEPSLARERGLQGLVARAAGASTDSRQDRPEYERIGYEPLMERDGDARARLLLRLDEAAQSIRMAAQALASRSPIYRPETEAAIALEGPRGPVLMQTDSAGLTRASQPGAAATRLTAAGSMVGLAWGNALMSLASFDLSPWELGDE